MPVQRIAEFDTWREGYAGATVTIYRAGSSTLANVFTDEGLTHVAPNPVQLITLTLDERRYGKFPSPFYTGQAIEMAIDGLDSTGVIRPPITDMEAEDVSEAVATASGAAVSHSIGDYLARIVYAVDFGALVKTGESGASSLTNNTTIETAIGAAGAQGGGIVILPPGVYDVIEFVIPPGVVVEGAGMTATYLQTTYAGPVFGLGGKGAGFRNLTLDGISQEGNSVGIYSIAVDETVLENMLVKRFETGLYPRGGERANWQNFNVSDCILGAKLHGDLNAGAGGGGEGFNGNRWTSGVVEFCQDAGIELKRVDAPCIFNTFEGVTFSNNTGIGVRLLGAHSTVFDHCLWRNNLVHMLADDGTPVDLNNTLIGLTVDGGQMAAGQLQLKNTLGNVIFDSVELVDVDVILTSPQNNVLALDCREDSLVTVTGASTNWTRASSINYPAASFGLTGGNAATKAWAIALKPGQKVYLEAKVIGRQRNGVNTAFYHLAVSAGRVGATLNYDTQTANFTVGNIVTGTTSQATGRITTDVDGGLTGVLTLQDVNGTFVDNEIITDGAGGSAMANGTQSTTATALIGTVTALRAAQETDASWDATFVANGPEIELRVTGASGQTVEWTVEPTVTST